MTYSNAFKADPARVRELAAEGYSQSAIGDMLGVSRERIRQICKRDGIETLSGRHNWDLRDRIAECAAAGMSVTEAAKAAGTSVSFVSELKRQGLTFAERELRWHEVRDAAAAGLTMTECARRMGWTCQEVWNQAKKHGIVFTAKHRKYGRSTKPIHIDGASFPDIAAAARALGVSRPTIQGWLVQGKAVRA